MNLFEFDVHGCIAGETYCAGGVRSSAKRDPKWVPTISGLSVALDKVVSMPVFMINWRSSCNGDSHSSLCVLNNCSRVIYSLTIKILLL